MPLTPRAAWFQFEARMEHLVRDKKGEKEFFFLFSGGRHERAPVWEQRVWARDCLAPLIKGARLYGQIYFGGAEQSARR